VACRASGLEGEHDPAYCGQNDREAHACPVCRVFGSPRTRDEGAWSFDSARPDDAPAPGLEEWAGLGVASQVAAQVATSPRDGSQLSLAGLVFLGYPLHPPGRPTQRRDRHLPAIVCPMLFVQGERDAFGNADEMRELVAGLPLAELYVVSGGNHSLETPKRAQPSRAAVMGAVQDYVAGWIRKRV
jgi:pimeloyl-ACP methyl ester carboxylesterase